MCKKDEFCGTYYCKYSLIIGYAPLCIFIVSIINAVLLIFNTLFIGRKFCSSTVSYDFPENKSCPHVLPLPLAKKKNICIHCLTVMHIIHLKTYFFIFYLFWEGEGTLFLILSFPTPFYYEWTKLFPSILLTLAKNSQIPPFKFLCTLNSIFNYPILCAQNIIYMT